MYPADTDLNHNLPQISRLKNYGNAITRASKVHKATVYLPNARTMNESRSQQKLLLYKLETALAHLFRVDAFDLSEFLSNRLAKRENNEGWKKWAFYDQPKNIHRIEYNPKKRCDIK
jgi:hypothetical protein